MDSLKEKQIAAFGMGKRWGGEWDKQLEEVYGV